MNALRHVFGFVTVALLAGSCASAQAAPSASLARPAAALKAAAVERGSVVQTVKLSGSVRSAAQYRLGFKQPGRLAERLVAAGDRVAAGQVLARLEAGELEAAVVAAQARYHQVVAGATAEDLASAKLAVDTAQRTFESAQRTSGSDLAAAKDALEQLVANYGAAKTTLATLTSGIAADAVSFKTGVDDSRALAKRVISDLQSSVGQTADVVTARNTMVGVDGALRTAQDLVAAMNAAYDDYVAKRDLLVAALGTFESSAAPTAKQGFQVALASFNDAAARYSASLDAILLQLTAATTSAASVDATLGGAALRIYPDLDGARADNARLQVQIAAARQSGGSVKSRIGQIAGAITSITAYVSGGLTGAEQAVTSAQERGGASLVASQNAVETARLSLQRTSAPPKAYDIAAAYAALLGAQSVFDGATLRAPAAGTILSIGAELGENVGGAFLVLDAAALELRGTVGESDVAKLNVGQRASVRIEALGGVTLSGTVTAIDAGATQASVPLYGVAVTIADPPAPLRTGMSGGADIVVASRENVIVVPSATVRTQGTRVFVQVVKDGQLTDREVKLGAANESMTEIASGLSEGEMVAFPRDRTR